MGRLNLATWVDCTAVEGPGNRFALWVQGCVQKCPECCNPHMFDLMPQHILEVDEVLSKIVHAQIEYGIEGVTFLGGEPMLQAKGLSKLAAECLNLQLSVVVFTGYTLEYLQTCSMPGVLELLKYVDLLIDGPYIASMPEKERNWVGSSNQRFHFLSKRYSSSIERDPTYSHGFELRISLDGTLKSNGWPNQFD